jgi:hypothetical protein
MPPFTTVRDTALLLRMVQHVAQQRRGIGDGAYPYDSLDEAMEQRIRKLFRRLGWFMPLLRPTGLTPG